MACALLPQVLEYIRQYSPCHGVRAQRYPSLFISTAVDDSRVSYREALKYMRLVRSACAEYDSKIANLKDGTTTYKDNIKPLLLLRVIEKGGHAGATSDEQHRQHLAQELAFLIDTVER